MPNFLAVAKDFSSSHSKSATPLAGPSGRPIFHASPFSNHEAITSSSFVACGSQSFSTGCFPGVPQAWPRWHMHLPSTMP